MEDILARSGVDFNRSTLYELMKQRVLQSKTMQADNASVTLIDPMAEGGSRTARFWANPGDKQHPFEVYDFTTTRERRGPHDFLRDYSGCRQAGAYGGYDGIYLKSNGTIKEVACWALCRRYWLKSGEEDAARTHQSSVQNIHLRC
jgi:transposase